jgi:hypothetical protein
MDMPPPKAQLCKTARHRGYSSYEDPQECGGLFCFSGQYGRERHLS